MVVLKNLISKNEILKDTFKDLSLKNELFN